jgi:hypothetical protein
MNQWDMDNLTWIRSAPEEEFQEWMSQASDDDIRYALELLAMARKQMTDEMTYLNDYEIVDFTDAKAFIERIKK